jgi:hypothetical protein
MASERATVSHILIEGVMYRITMVQSDNCYRAEWYCHDCAESSAVCDRAYDHHHSTHP